MHAVWREEPQRRGFVHVDRAAERTITVIGDRLGPRGEDDLPWELLDEADAVYFTAGDAAAAREARRARTMVATPRGLETLVESGVELDALVASGKDEGERYARRARPGAAGGGAHRGTRGRNLDRPRRRDRALRSGAAARPSPPTPTAPATASPPG